MTFARHAAAAMLLLSPLPAAAQDCAYEVPPVAQDDPHFGPLSLHRFGDRWELQVETPSQDMTMDGVFLLDDEIYPNVLVLPGLDDALVSITDEPDSLGLSAGFFDALVSSRTAAVTGTAGGIPHRADYALGDIVSATTEMALSCRD